ncbi:MAG: ATP-binding protein [Treponema sp.]|nr:ATP-binding protein [Treponema sp.]
MDRSGKILDLRNIHVSYGPVKALDGIDLDLYEGELHGLVGEHRAGKSTLVKVLGGTVRIDEGSITIMGRHVDSTVFRNTAADRIGIVYQELTIVPHLNAVENIHLGRMSRRGFRSLDHASMRRHAEETFAAIGCSVDLRLPLYRLKRAEQHLVEFAKALAFDPKILILDELSNKLTPEEMEIIYRAIFNLRDRGCGIIYISHDLDEILRLANRVTVLKGGHRRLTVDTEQLDKRRLFEFTYSFRLDEQQQSRDDAPMIRLRRYLQSVIQFLPVGVFLLDEAGEATLYNLAADEIFSLGADGAAQQPFMDLLERLSGDQVATDEFRRKFAERASFDREELSMTSGKTLRLRSEVLVDQTGDDMGTLVVAEDVSLDRHISDYVLEKAKMTTLAQLAVGVAHEINNPLFVIQNYLEVIRDRNENPEIEDRIARIDKEVGRIVEIVSSLLSFSRTKTANTGTRVAEVVDTVLILLQFALKEKSILVDLDLPDTEITANFDENKLTQVLLNLISNAIDAVLIGGRIGIGLQKDDADWVALRVTDNGCGIPDDIAAKVFDPFFTTKLGRKNTGLGLSICKHIVDENEGSIAFESEPGRGSTFIIMMRRTEAAQGSPSSRNSS